MRRRRLLQLSAGIGTVGLAGCQTGDDDTGGGNGNGNGDGNGDEGGDGLPRLHTEGKWVVDEDGNEVVLRGVNLIEPLFGRTVDEDRGGDYEDTLELALDESEGWYNRVVRLPITEWGVQGDGLEEHFDGEMERYFEEFVDPTVERCSEENTYVIVDYHLIENWDDESVHELIEEFWDVAAPRYADEPHVLYEPFNEPYRPAEDSLENWEAFKESFQPIVDRIREDAPETPIVVGSPNLTSHTKYAAESPLEGENLIYAGHIYPGEGDSPEDWDPEYGDVADEVPVLLTEWGFDAVDDVQPGDREWGEAFREWVDGKENVGWTAWCLDSHWEPTMVDFDFNLRGGELFHGWFTKEWLFEKRNDRVPEAARSGEDATFEGEPDGESPHTPRNVSVEENADGEVVCSWEHEARTDSAVVNHYEISVDGEVRERAKLLHLANEQADGDFTREEYAFEVPLSGINPGQEYRIHVTAVDGLSNKSLPSQVVRYQAGGELEIHAELPRIDDSPAIDGDDDWADVPAHDLENVLMEAPASDGDVAATWRGAWDEEALYVLVDVTDDERSVDENEPAYENDSVELFVDANNSKLADYDGEHDFQLIFERDTGRIAEGTLPTNVGDVDHAQVETDDGWRLEVALPWSILGVEDAVGVGHLVGFDVHVNDNDTGGSRDTKVTWHDENDAGWEDPSVFGNVELVE